MQLIVTLALADPLQLSLEGHNALDGLEGGGRVDGRLAEIQLVELVTLMVQLYFQISFSHGLLVPQFRRVVQHEAACDGVFTRTVR